MARTTTTTAAEEEEEMSCNQLTAVSSDHTGITIRFHTEYEKIIPKLKPDEYQELKSSIAKNGLYHPIIINKDGKQKMSKADEKGNDIKWNYYNDSHEQNQQQHYCATAVAPLSKEEEKEKEEEENNNNNSNNNTGSPSSCQSYLSLSSSYLPF